jgi:alpha-beta hydrolase superfamily lysophospholipase
MIALMGAIRRAIRPRYVILPRLSDAELAALTMKMLVVIGGRDVLIDSDGTRARLAAHAPHADVRYLPEGYHYLPGLAGTVQEFLLSR